jgi:hypothetical protein
MGPASFKTPVVIEPRLGRFREVRTVQQAAEVLLRDWPTAECVKRRKAMVSCLAVIREEEAPKKARQDFVAAARKARIMVTKKTPNGNPPTS